MDMDEYPTIQSLRDARERLIQDRALWRAADRKTLDDIRAISDEIDHRESLKIPEEPPVGTVVMWTNEDGHQRAAVRLSWGWQMTGHLYSCSWNEILRRGGNNLISTQVQSITVNGTRVFF